MGKRVKGKRIYYLCHECAMKLGWRDIPGHYCTAHSGKCDVCGEEKTLTCENDYLHVGEVLKARRIERWD